MSKKIIVIYALVLAAATTGAVLFIRSSLANSFPAGTAGQEGSGDQVRAVPNDETDLSFQVGGKITFVAKQVGDMVKKDEVLAKLDNTDALAQYAQAQGNLAAAKADLGALKKTLLSEQLRVKGLRSTARKIQDAEVATVKKNIASQEARVSQAQVSLNDAASQLDKYVLKAPLDGVVVRQNMVVGEIFNPNNPSVITIKSQQ